jgi:hypothetical protein
VTASVIPHLGKITQAWCPCDSAESAMVATLKTLNVPAVATSSDFLAFTAPPAPINAIVCNPPYGVDRRGTLAEQFIEHALRLEVARIAMLLRNDFDSAIGRQHLFRHNSAFSCKLVLLGRIRWFDGPSSPSDNHSWFVWNHKHRGPPIVRYVTRREAES